MKKVLICCSGFYPARNFGGPTVSLKNLCKLINNEVETYVITLNHDLNSLEKYSTINDGWNNVDGTKVLYLSNEELTVFKLGDVIKELKPDLIYLNSFFDAKFTIPMMILSRIHGLPVLLAARGEFYESQFQIKKPKKVIYLLLFKLFFLSKLLYFHSTSNAENEQIEKFFNVKKNKIFIISNVPDIPSSMFGKKKKEENQLKVIFLARISVEKNLLYALKVLEKVNGNVNYNIYGNIENKKYWLACQQQIEKLPKNIKVNYCGTLERENIHKTLFEHDIMFFPTLSENYGHSIVESMLSNCPIVISDQTPWTDVNESNAGWALPLENIKAFIDTLNKLVNMGNVEYQEIVANNKKYVYSKLDIINLKSCYINAIKKITGWN